MPMTPHLPIKAYARARGCSPAAVRKAIVRLGIPRDVEGRVDTAAAERLWPREAANHGGTGGEPPDNPPDNPPDTPRGEVVTYAEARRRRELAKAQREEIGLAVAQGHYGSIEYLDAQLSGCLIRVRQILLNLPGKIAPQLVGVPTVARAQIILQEAIDEAMPTLQAIGSDPSLDSDDPFVA